MKEYKRRKLNQLGKYGWAVIIPAEWMKYHKALGYDIREVDLQVYEDRIVVVPRFGTKGKGTFDEFKQPRKVKVLSDDVCSVCGKPLGDDIYHIEDTIGHYICLTNKVRK